MSRLYLQRHAQGGPFRHQPGGRAGVRHGRGYDPDGDADGASLGDSDGTALGDADGTSLGEVAGDVLGDAEGTTVGASVGTGVALGPHADRTPANEADRTIVIPARFSIGFSLQQPATTSLTVLLRSGPEAAAWGSGRHHPERSMLRES